MSGAGTNRACAHVLAVAKVLCGRDLFRTTKRNAGALTDVHVPRSQQPALKVPPLLGQNVQLVPEFVPRRSSDSRKNLLPIIYGNFSMAGHKQFQMCNFLFKNIFSIFSLYAI